MALSTYADLQAAIPVEAWRSDWSSDLVQDFIKRAEGKLNRKLKSDDVEASLSGTAGSRYVSTSAYAVVAPTAVWITAGSEEVMLNANTLSGLANLSSTSRPTEWAFDNYNKRLVFNTLLDQAYPIRFLHVSKFELSDSVTTNWLLENYPDVYLNACLAEGSRYMKDYGVAADYDRNVKEAISEIRAVVADRKRGRSTVDPALRVISVGSSYNINSDL